MFSGQLLRYLAGGLALLVVTGCHAGSGGVSFEGRSSAPLAAPEEVLETTAMPDDVTRLGRLHARCRAPEGWTAFRGRALADVDCSKRRLRRMMREVGARNGGNILAGLECETGKNVSCSAALGRGALPARTGPPMYRVLAGDAQGIGGSNVRVDFVPLVADPRRPPREVSIVGDLPLLPPSHVLVGSFATECTECTELQARDALRIAAAHFGASDVIGVRCFQWGPGFQCAGSAAMTRVVE